MSIFLLVRTKGSDPLRLPVQVETLEHQSANDWRHIVVPLRTDSTESNSKTRRKGRLAEIGVLVEARYPSAIHGVVEFDEVRFLEKTEDVFHLDHTAAIEPGPPGSTELKDRLAVNIHLLRATEALNLAHEAGFRFVRMDLLWAAVERNGRYRFFPYDRLMEALESRGMGVLWILDYGHPQHGGDRPQTQEDILAFARYAAAVASHFKGHDVRYEIWNEPNNGQFWKPAPDAAEYGRLLQETARAIHQADPSAQVSAGGIARIDLSFIRQILASGAARNVNAIGVHPYRTTAPETIVPELLLLRALVSKELGEQVEIWDTEWGYSSRDAPSKPAQGDGHQEAARQWQAVQAVREVLTVWALNFPVAVWYDLHDDGPDPTNAEHNYGLLDSDNRDKPAMKALRTLSQVANSRNHAGLIRDLPDGLHAMRLDGTTDTVIVLWTEREQTTISFSIRDFISATNMFGESIHWSNADNGDGTVALHETNGPIYLHWGHR